MAKDEFFAHAVGHIVQREASCFFLDADILSEMLYRIDEKSPFFGEAKVLLKKLSFFEKISPDFLPKDSLLREFVG